MGPTKGQAHVPDADAGIAVNQRAIKATVRIPRVRRMRATLDLGRRDFREIRHVRDGFVRNDCRLLDLGELAAEAADRLRVDLAHPGLCDAQDLADLR